MARSKNRGQLRWRAQRTLLIVGEGAHDCAFLSHVKAMFAPRGQGLQVKIRDAHGKGAKHVLEYARRLRRGSSYDSTAALFDTDTDWNPAVDAAARKSRIILLTADPCLEAMLLRLLGHEPSQQTHDCKRVFAQRYVGEDPGNAAAYMTRFTEMLPTCFTEQFLKGARGRDHTIDKLINLFDA